MEEVDYDEIMETYDAEQQAKKCFKVVDAETLIEYRAGEIRSGRAVVCGTSRSGRRTEGG